MSEDAEDKKVVDLAEARQRQRTVRAAKEQTRRGAKSQGRPTGPKKLWVYVQVLVFLAVVAYFMRLCRGP